MCLLNLSRFPRSGSRNSDYSIDTYEDDDMYNSSYMKQRAHEWNLKIHDPGKLMKESGEKLLFPKQKFSAYWLIDIGFEVITSIQLLYFFFSLYFDLTLLDR